MPIIESVIAQHAEDAAFSWTLRDAAVAAPQVSLDRLADLDERVEAHIDGLRIAGEAAWSFCAAGLGQPECGDVFAATVVAVESDTPRWMGRVCATVEAAPETVRGLVSALGWTSFDKLRRKLAALLASSDPFWRATAIAAFAMHRVDCGSQLARAIDDPDPRLGARALRAAGEIGRCDLLHACLGQFRDQDEAIRFRAAASALLLGDRDRSLSLLEDLATRLNPWRERALALWLKAVDLPSANRVLRTMAQVPGDRRLPIQCVGIAGDAQRLPWLIDLMSDDRVARLAGESFATIAGLDLAALGLERKPPANFESWPSDDPEDPNVATSPDEGLPWPDATKLQSWWAAHRQRFQPGVRYFAGEPVNVDGCRRVLRQGYQRQRRAAAEYLCLLAPGAPLFPIAAPAWRQIRSWPTG